MPFVSKAQLRTCYAKKMEKSSRKSTSRKSTSRKSTSRKSTSRKSTSRKSTSRKSTSSKKEWDCDEWLEETKSVCALPEKKGLPVKKRNAKVGERIVGKLQTGPRGGQFFCITEKNTRGKEICVVKVYV